MKCDECRILLEHHIEGVLDASRASLVRAHLESCASCVAEHQMLKDEQQLYARYQRDIEVTPAIWASIERRINAEADTSGKRQTIRPEGGLLGRLFAPLSGLRLSPALVAAMVVLAIGATVVVTKYSERPPAPVPPIAQNPPPPVDEHTAPSTSRTTDGEPTAAIVAGTSGKTESGPSPRRAGGPRKLTAAELVRDAENKYLSAIAMLTRDAKRREATLDPAARTRFETALAIIDNTIEETRQAARQNPNDPIALQYLLTAYGKKVEALREMARE